MTRYPCLGPVSGSPSRERNQDARFLNPAGHAPACGVAVEVPPVPVRETSEAAAGVSRRPGGTGQRWGGGAASLERLRRCRRDCRPGGAVGVGGLVNQEADGRTAV